LDVSHVPIAAELSELLLPCSSWQEAHDIVDDLLKQRLITHAQFLPITASDTITLVMRALASDFERIARAVSKLQHGVDALSLQPLPLAIMDEPAPSDAHRGFRPAVTGEK